MLEQIARVAPGLPAAERKVAQCLLEQPHRFMRTSVAEIAREAQVSQPTVIRFARSLGYAGLQELKLRLAASLSEGTPFVHASVGEHDAMPEVTVKVFDNVINALMRCRNASSAQALERACALIAGARRVEFYGLGNSGIVAADAQHKFFRYGISTVAYADPHTQSMAASLLGPHDMLVAISNSGRTQALLEAVRIARDGGCSVIALTAPGSPLAELASVRIFAESDEDSDVYSPMTSRILHLTLIDVLAVGVALKLGPGLAETLRKTKRSLQRHRVSRAGG